MAASASSSRQAVVKRPSSQNADLSLMPPPPFKRIRRPPTVLDEDEYTSALSDIIARDYFPGLLESQAQHEYLAALESGNESWIAEAAQKLRNAGAPWSASSSSGAPKKMSSARNTRFDNKAGNASGSGTPRWRRSGGIGAGAGGAGAGAGSIADTPVGSYAAGSETPVAAGRIEKDSEHGDEHEHDWDDQTSGGEGGERGRGEPRSLSLGAFQAKYTSEDNESFNALLDKQNFKRRQKHAYMWTQDQRVPSARLIAWRAKEMEKTRLLEEAASGEEKQDGQEGQQETTNKNNALIVPSSSSSSTPMMMTTGATDARPARPDAWLIKRPDNSFMFPATSIDEDAPGLPTVQEVKEQNSKAGPKHVVLANTRFPPMQRLQYDEEPQGPIPPSPSLNTDIIARRDAARGAIRGAAAAATNSTSLSQFDDGDSSYAGGEIGGETPRVNGYAFVDEDEPENIQQQQAGPSYRDLLAGQVGDATPNPFKIGDIRPREELHLRLVEKQARRKRDKERDPSLISRTPGTGSRTANGNNMTSTSMMNMTPGTAAAAAAAAAAAGNMTPAARRLMEKLGGRTPVTAAGHPIGHGTGGGGDSSASASKKTNIWTPTARTPRRKK